MNMSLTTHSSLRMLVAGAFAVASAACASAPPPPAAAAAPPPNAFAQAASPGAAEAQGDDGVVFVDQGRKDPTTHQDSAPATGLHADSQTTRPASPQH
jgi:hypothetical protein